jgi:lipopolysaccharide export system permease protein
MIRIKRLYTFVLGTFLPLMLATYSVCLFILLMQFVWQFVNDMVGKGVGMNVMAELFFYACISFTPQALPLAILLASLMAFGNLGEHLELLAMKASGISLIRIMKPLIGFAIVLAVVSFFFQSEIAPRARAKMYTIVLSLRQKSPALDIPEGVFYKEITGHHFYVRHKDPDGLLRDLMIYDYSDGFDNAEIIVADSGRLSISADKKHLALKLHDGALFRNWGNRRSRSANEKIPYMRETFHLRDILISFDTNFTMADESIMGSREINKNRHELAAFIDSVGHERDSIQKITALPFKNNVYGSTFRTHYASRLASLPLEDDSLLAAGFDAYYTHLPPARQLDALRQAKRRTEQIDSDYNFTSLRQADAEKQFLAHRAQYYQHYAMALSCVLFFFIGAPLGAIIRKGGLGMPTVLSVFLYLLYYTVDTFGVKMGKQAVWPMWQGVWLSTAMLAGLGLFFTFKAVNDSTMIDPDTWKIFLRKLTGRRETRYYARKEIIMTPPDYPRNLEALKDWNIRYHDYLRTRPQRLFHDLFFRRGLADPALDRLIRAQEAIIDNLCNSSEPILLAKLTDYPLIRPLRLDLLSRPAPHLASLLVFPLGLTIYALALRNRRQTTQDLMATEKLNDWMITEIEKRQKNLIPTDPSH